MDSGAVPEFVSHDSLLAALEMRTSPMEPHPSSVYEVQLKHQLMTNSRKAHLEVTVHQLTGIAPSELRSKSTAELLILLDRYRSSLQPGDVNLLRYWW